MSRRNGRARSWHGLSRRARALTLLALAGAALALACQPPEEPREISLTPAWQAPGDKIPTGVGWADVDGNGWQDLVITQGLDARFGRNHVYFNHEGTLAAEPGWTSADTLPSGNLALGDFDSDGDPDLVATSMGNLAGEAELYPHCIYMNEGGTFEEAAGWKTPPTTAFSCALGDPDGDGDLDIAFGGGLSAVDTTKCRYMQASIWLNEGGRFGDAPGWQSAESRIFTEVCFGDVNGDGWQDLAASGRPFGVVLFMNHGGTLERMPSWAKDDITGGCQMAFGDVDGDGYPELAIGEVGEYGSGGGRFILLKNDGGTLRREPLWTCSGHPEPAAVAWADVDADGDLDLGAGGWNEHVGVFENVGGTLSDDYVWSHTPGWLEQIAWGDYDRDGIVRRTKRLRGDGQRHFFDLGEKAIVSLDRVSVAGRDLALDEYCGDPAEGWISVADAPADGAELTVDYTASTRLDLAATSTRRTRVYRNVPQVIPSDVKVLVLVDDQFGANLNFDSSYFLLGKLDNNILNHFKRYGWEVTTAAVEAHVDSCAESGEAFGSPSFDVDMLLADVRDVGAWDVVMVAPGSAHAGLLASEDALRVLRAAREEGLVIAGWCKGSQVLAAAGLLEGKRVVGNADQRELLEKAGATFVGNDHVPVIDGDLVTVVRSSHHRTDGCEAMATAVNANARWRARHGL